VVSVHDLGIGCLDADLVIDGSVTRCAQARRGETLAGPQYAVMDPALAAARQAREPHSVLVALGGGPRAELALDIARAIVDADPRVRVRVAGGFISASDRGQPRIAWLGPSRSLHGEMARASVAVVGGGVSLYEACAQGTPAVGVPVVRAQVPTVMEFVRRGATRGVTRLPVAPGRVAEECVHLLSDAALRRRLARAGQRLVDGLGAVRAAAAVKRLAQATGRG
jgi:spore coat polysaccharide biosynthesis predicted glycosyltransferase SpsG